jgi:hypothetical protein
MFNPLFVNPLFVCLFVCCIHVLVSTGDGLLDYSEFVDAALVGSKTKRRGNGGPRGSPRARRWGRNG